VDSLNQIITSKVGKKGAIYLPKRILKHLGINEGDTVLIKPMKGRVVLEFINDPLSLALKVKKWAKTNVREFERESEEEQNEIYNP